MALIRQTDRRTGTVYVYEAEARWDPKRKQSRYGRRRLVGHVDPGTPKFPESYDVVGNP